MTRRTSRADCVAECVVFVIGHHLIIFYPNVLGPFLNIHLILQQLIDLAVELCIELLMILLYRRARRSFVLGRKAVQLLQLAVVLQPSRPFLCKRVLQLPVQLLQLEVVLQHCRSFCGIAGVQGGIQSSKLPIILLLHCCFKGSIERLFSGQTSKV